MAAVPVDLHPETIAEAAAAVKWYRERSDLASVALVAELDRAIASIAEAPDRWPQYLYETCRFLLHRFPFSVVYRRVKDIVEVIAVAHARRKPGYWKKR